MSSYEPMKAVRTDRPFTDPGWVFERKLDGMRCGAIRSFERLQRRMQIHRHVQGEAALREACRRGWEGLIAKRVESPYREGLRYDKPAREVVREVPS
jgi:ATP-dependent DNA ligase